MMPPLADVKLAGSLGHLTSDLAVNIAEQTDKVPTIRDWVGKAEPNHWWKILLISSKESSNSSSRICFPDQRLPNQDSITPSILHTRMICQLNKLDAVKV